MTLPKLNNDICHIIASYLIKPKYKLLDWIDIDDINYRELSFNKNAIDFLKENPQKIDWYALTFNSEASLLLNNNH